ncbi:hypothetical protein SCARD494_08430 [Seiridium cardinale]
MFKTMVHTFKRDLTDYYLGRAFVEFSPLATPDPQKSADKLFEFCCLLPYVDRNQHVAEDLPNDSRYREVLQWSVRQQALYSSNEPDSSKRETTVLVNPADDLWLRIKDRYRLRQSSVLLMKDGKRLPKRDAAVTRFDHPYVGEANAPSLRDGLEMMDRLENAHHVLGTAISTLSMIQAEAQKHETIWRRDRAEAEKMVFAHRIGSVVRQLGIERSQVQRIITRLNSVVEIIRDLVNLRSTNTMEKMTARTVMEARTMRAIAVVTLCFLPPTFIAGFLDMGYINVASGGGSLRVGAEPGLFLHIAITIPLVLVILGGYLWWDWRSLRNPKSPHGNLV